MALVFVTGFNNDSSSGNFLLNLGDKGPHRLRRKRPCPKFLKKRLKNKLQLLAFLFIQLTSRYILIF